MRWRNATHAFVENLRELLVRGSRIRVRGQDTLELQNRVIRLEYPLERCTITPGRRNNIFATIAETMWVLAGRNDIPFLALYLPRAKEFSDDGYTWRAGYGPRLRSWHGVDQLSAVAGLLRADRNTRRGVMSIFDPAEDFVESRDIPCSNWIHCYIRDNALHMNVAVRSNDIVWGFSGINTFEWSVIQEILAYWTGARTGTATFFVSSLHLYSWHEQRAIEILERFPYFTCYESDIHSVSFQTPPASFDEALNAWFVVETAVREDPDKARGAVEAYGDPLFRHFLSLLRVYAGARTWPSEVLRAELAALPETDLTFAAYEYFSRDPKRGIVPDPARHPRLARYWNTFTRARHVETSLANRLRARISGLHARKSAAYGDSWKRRGEVLGVLANIARKVDRLERATLSGGGTRDEALMDTAVDLLVYALKYITFLADEDDGVARRIFGESGPAAPFSQGAGGFDQLLSRMDFCHALGRGTTSADAVRGVLTCFTAVEGCFRGTAAIVGAAERASRAENLADAALATVAAVVRASPSAARAVFGSDDLARGSENETV